MSEAKLDMASRLLIAAQSQLMAAPPRCHYCDQPAERLIGHQNGTDHRFGRVVCNAHERVALRDAEAYAESGSSGSRSRK